MAETTLDLTGLNEKKLEAGATLIAEGTPAEKVYVLKEGVVSVSVGGKEIHEESQTGTFFGEISVLLKQDHSATVEAKTACVFCVIDDLLDFVKTNPQVALGIAEVLAARVIRLHGALLGIRDEAVKLGSGADAAGKAKLSGLWAILNALDEFTDRDILHPLTPARPGGACALKSCCCAEKAE